MKIRTNLLQAQRPFAARLVAVPAWLLATVLGIGASLVIVDAFGLRAARVEFEAHLARIESARTSAAQTSALPAAAELEAMTRRVSALNALTGVARPDTAELLIWLETHLPEDVQLTRVHHRAREGNVLLVAEAWRAEPLAKLLGDLEKAPHFDAVLLVRQGTRSVQGRGEMVQFEIRIEIKAEHDRHA